MKLLSVENIGLKIFGRKICDNISFDVYKNKSIAIFGQQKTGKSAIILMLAGFLNHTTGKIVIHDKKIKSHQTFIGAGVFEHINTFYDELSVIDNINFFVCSLLKNNTKDITNKIIKKWDLDSIKNQQIKHISAFDKAIVSIAVSLIKNPEIILLDEPTKFLTHKQTLNYWKTIQPILKEKTLIFTTLKEYEAKQFANKIFMIEGGNINDS